MSFQPEKTEVDYISTERAKNIINKVLDPKPSGRFFHLTGNNALAFEKEDALLLPLPTLRESRSAEESRIEIGNNVYTIIAEPRTGASTVFFLDRIAGEGPEHLVAKSILSPRLLLNYPDFANMYVDKLAKKRKAADAANYDPYRIMDDIRSVLQKFGDAQQLDYTLKLLLYAELEQSIPNFDIYTFSTSLDVRKQREKEILDATKVAINKFGESDSAKIMLEQAILAERTIFREEMLLRFLKSQGTINVPTSEGIAFDITTGEIYVLMERLEGRNLEQVITSLDNYDIVKRLDYFNRLATAISQLHSPSIDFAHGDIKPANVFLTEKDELYILDLGNAKSITGKDDDFVRGVGTEPYAAPELYRGGVPTIASDIYALGVILQHLTTNSLPRQKDDATYTIIIDELLPPKAKQVVAKATHADPSQRYHSVEEFLIALTNTEFGPQSQRRGV